MTKDQIESQLPLAAADLGAVFFEALTQAQPAPANPLKKAVLNGAQAMRDRGEEWELAAESLPTLSRALHDPTAFPLRS